MISNGNNFDMVGLIALKDKNRATVKSCITNAVEVGKMKVTMISGDHQTTCKEVAKKAGIITEDDLSSDLHYMISA